MEFGELQLFEERKVWEKNSEFLYDFVATKRLPHPSLSVDSHRNPDMEKLLVAVGTHKDDESIAEGNQVIIYECQPPELPLESEYAVFADFDEYSGFPWKTPLENFRTISIPGEANRLRFVDAGRHIVAASSSGSVVILNVAKSEVDPVEVAAHTSDCWDTSTRQDSIVSVGEDRRICIIKFPGDQASDASVVQKWENCHEKAIQSVIWAHTTQHSFITVADDGHVRAWDSRQPNVAISCGTAEFPLNSVDTHEDSPFIVAAAGGAQEIVFWDMRQMDRTLHHINAHEATISSLRFHPKHKELLLTTADDRRVIVWDLGLCGAEQDVQDADDGPPELIFSHGGHIGNVTDAAWVDTNSNEFDRMVVSVSLAGELHLWHLNGDIEKDGGHGKCPFVVEP